MIDIMNGDDSVDDFDDENARRVAAIEALVSKFADDTVPTMRVKKFWRFWSETPRNHAARSSWTVATRKNERCRLFQAR